MSDPKAVMTDMCFSQKILYEAAPIIKRLLNCVTGEILDVENQNNIVCQHLDQQCGIDYLVHFEGLTNGLAWRAQQEDPFLGPFNSFTIRKERESGAMTEFEKRKKSIEMSALYPYYTAQAFYGCRNKELKTLGIARTKDIIECIEKGLCSVNETGKAQIGQAKFYTVWWKVMKKNGYQVLEWKL